MAGDPLPLSGSSAGGLAKQYKVLLHDVTGMKVSKQRPLYYKIFANILSALPRLSTFCNIKYQILYFLEIYIKGFFIQGKFLYLQFFVYCSLQLFTWRQSSLISPILVLMISDLEETRALPSQQNVWPAWLVF